MNTNAIRRIVALIAASALTFALVGTASALTGKGTVDKNDLQKNSVKAKAIKSNAVTGPKIKAAAVTGEKIADAAIATAKLVDGSVTTPKLAENAVTSAKLADNAVATSKIADNAVTSAKVAADTLTADDIAPGVLSVVAYGRVINPGAGAPTIATGDVGLLDVVGGTDDAGRTDLFIEPSVLPAGSLSACSVQATPAADSVPNVGSTLGYDTVTVATGSPAPANMVQAQTRGAAEALNDFDYFVQVTCSGV